MTTIVLTRHGDVPWLDPERFRGRAELNLTAAGIAQAQAAARRIRASWQACALYASPMGRTLHTGRLIAEPQSLQVQAMEELIDIDYGNWQGLTRDEAVARWPAEAERWFRRPDLVQIPGGETLQDVLARVARALQTITQRHPDQTVIVVAHDSVNRVLLMHALGLPLACYRQIGQDPCAINLIDASDDGFLVRTINETGHLQEIGVLEG